MAKKRGYSKHSDNYVQTVFPSLNITFTIEVEIILSARLSRNINNPHSINQFL